MQCQGETNYGTRCSRIVTSTYCWQHQKNLKILDVIPLDILREIFLFAGTITPINKQYNTLFNRRKILATWFQQIGVLTPFAEVKEKEIPFLWNLYQTRIDNVPNKILLKKAEYKINKYIFYSQTFNYYDHIEGVSTYSLYNKQDMKIINQTLADFVRFNKLRKGDSIFIDIETQEGMVIYDGQQLLQAVRHHSYDRDILPKEIIINDYPHVKYFESNYVPIVNFNTDNTVLELVNIHPYQNTYYEFKIHTQKLKYRLFTVDPNLGQIWNGIVFMDIEGDIFYDTYPTDEDYDSSDYRLGNYIRESNDLSILYHIDKKHALEFLKP